MKAVDGKKYCPKCKETKDVTDFGISRIRNDGFNTYCSICAKEISAKSRKKNNEENKKNGRDYYHKKSKYDKKRLKNNSLNTKYGINLEYFKNMLLSQNNKCAICSIIFDDKFVPCVDHCHKTKKVRELLCSNCNTALGMVDENIDIMISINNYLRRNNV